MKYYFSGGSRVPCMDYDVKGWDIYYLNKGAFLAFCIRLRRYFK